VGGIRPRVDTRSKILSVKQALLLEPARPLVLVTGCFDILRATHIRELAEIRTRSGAATLLIAVLPLAGELLDQRSRAELVAALQMVDYVLTADHEDLAKIIGALHPLENVALEPADALRIRQLIEHVHRRQSS